MPASAPGSASSSPDSASAAGFSSAPINPVVTHNRRHKSDGGWPSDAQSQKDTSPSSSGTQDEDIRSKARPSSAGSQASTKQESTDQAPNQTLPSLSSGGAALLQLREHKNSPSSSNNNRPSEMDTGSQLQNTPATAQNHMLFRSREEGNPLIPDEDMDEEQDEEEDVEEDDPSAPPSPHDRDMRIMFHGREIFAEDLIGLRVAKTFAGQGRFLGQVVKFDKRVSLYTVVYADGDAEDLAVDATLQILIQDEIERADPAQPPPAISLLFKKGEDGSTPTSPDTGDFMMQPPPAQRQTSNTQRRTRIQVSEREAQFVISLFENHALPSLVRQGWRVQSSSSGRDTRFLSPVGEIFPSALDVVGFIASDSQLLTACFPANVHSAILSLLPPEAQPSTASAMDTGSNHGSSGSASRKRTTSDSPGAQQLDGKRTRPTREEAYALPVRGMARSGDAAQYRPEDLDRRAEAASRMSAYRGQGMGGRIRMSGDRFVSGETTSEAHMQAPPDMRGYRRRDPTLENPFTSRWPGGDPATGRIDAEYARRFVDSPGWRERAEPYLPDRPLEAHPRTRIRAEGRYTHRLNARNPTDAADGSDVSGGRSYYRDSTESSPGGQASPMTTSGSYPQYRARTGEYRSSEIATRMTAVPRVSRETASFMSPTDTLGASAAFSMVDVDRISKSRPGSAHEQQPRGRSPRQSEAYMQHQSLQHHHRTNSGHSYHSQRGGEGHYSAEPTSEAQGEQPSSTAGGTNGASNQQQHE
ncbi:hypothetical protein PRIC1_009619 [Phytophthora ramorum]